MASLPTFPFPLAGCGSRNGIGKVDALDVTRLASSRRPVQSCTSAAGVRDGVDFDARVDQEIANDIRRSDGSRMVQRPASVLREGSRGATQFQNACLVCSVRHPLVCSEIGSDAQRWKIRTEKVQIPRNAVGHLKRLCQKLRGA